MHACTQMEGGGDDDMDDAGLLPTEAHKSAIVPKEAELAERFGQLALETAATRPSSQGDYPEEVEDGHELRTICTGEITKMIGVDRADLSQCAPHASGLDEKFGCEIFGYDTTETNHMACVTLLIRADEGVEIPGGTTGVYGMKCLGVLQHEGEINIAALWEVVSNRVACVVAIYPTKGVDAACMKAQNEWLQQQRVTYGAEDAGKTEEEDAEGGMRMAEATWAEAPKPRPKGWRLTLTLRVLGKGFPSDPVEQHAEMLRLQEEITSALWNQMRIEAWQKEPIDPMSLTHLTPNAVDAVQFHLGTMNRWEDAMPIRATKCGEVPSIKNDPAEMGVWLDVKIRQQPGAEPTLMRLKVEGGRDAQVEIERAHLCGANLVEDHAPLAPCPGRMYNEMLRNMKSTDGSRMMFCEFYERTCDEADADGGPGDSTTVCPLMVAYTVMRYHQGSEAGTWRRCAHGKGCSQNLMCGGLAPDISKVVTKEMAQRLQHTYEINRDVSLRAAQARIKKAEDARRELLGGGVSKRVRTMSHGQPWRGGKGGSPASGKGNAWGKSPAGKGGSSGKGSNGGKGHGGGRTWAAAWDAPSPPSKGGENAKRGEAPGSSSSSARTGLEERLGTQPVETQMKDAEGSASEEEGEIGKEKNDVSYVW